MRVDLDRRLASPERIRSGSLRPDILIWSTQGKKMVTVELTVPWEERCCHLAGYAWMEDGPLCVKMHSNSVNWDTAKTLCEQDHGRLAILDNAKLHQAYFNYGGDGYRDAAWIGVTDQDTEGSWVWLNGADLNTSYWSFVQLNNYDGYLPDKFNADCAATGGYGGIIDLHCLKTKPFICQRIDLE
ncbi:C-type lectin domain family 17, member A-like [Argopecten irradians]|uniref:C-type lectin domain family 17, member A-like n=1 Tax=Argopecten irradians TaxID=31199 RepID=UPI003715F830